ncbi:hypothetical protein Tco_1250322 [Tanacetum coccineum]
MHKTALTAEAQENVAKVQEKILEEDIAREVDGEDEESYASEFTDLVFQDDDDDSGKKIEPESHKEHPKIVDDDDENEKEKKDNKKDDDEKKDDAKDNDNDDHIDHTLAKQDVFPSGIAMLQELFTGFAGANAIDDLIDNNLKRVMADTVIQERDAFQAKVPALISKEFVDHAPKIIEELFKNYMQNNMKSNLQDQATDPALDDASRPQHHDDHQEDHAPPKGEKRTKRQKTSKSSKSVRGSSSKQPTNTGLIYLNKKEEKKVMYLIKIVKFCNTTLERVLKEVNLKIFETEFWKKPPLLDEQVGIVREWKTNSSSDEAPVIINP